MCRIVPTQWRPVSLAVLAALIAASLHASGAVRYRFESVSEGARPGHSSGQVLVDGKRWRVDLDPDPDKVRAFTTVISDEAAQTVAINATNETWYRLKTGDRTFGAHSFLFSFGMKPEVSAVRVSVGKPRDPGVTARLTYSYTTTVDMAGTRVRAFVTGQVDLWTRADPTREHLPWQPAEVETGFSEVDEALAKAVTEVGGMIWKAKIDVSRRLEGGAAYSESITRTISDVTEAKASAGDFKVPAGYANQEPVIGAPGGSPHH